MKEILRTERLILREFGLSDAECFYRLNADPDVIKYTGDLPFNSIDDAELFLANYNEYGKNGYGRWAVIDKESGSFIGWCGLKLNEENLIDLGFRFFKSVWGKGYATESARACLDYGFSKLNLKTIIARTMVNNIPSVKVLEKIGMKFWKEDYCEGLGNTLYYIKKSNK